MSGSASVDRSRSEETSLPGVARQAGLLSASGLLLLLGLAAGFFAQGGYFPDGRRPLVLAIAAAAVLALVARPPCAADLRFPPVVAAGALIAWDLARGLMSGRLGESAAQSSLVLGVVVVLMVGRRLDTASRETVLLGLVGIGVALAASGWVGVAFHHTPWALPGEGLWRASSTLTYSNATAAVLVPLALVTVSLLAARPRNMALAAALSLLLLGAGATLSRAGLLSLLVGLVAVALLATASCRPCRPRAHPGSGPGAGGTTAVDADRGAGAAGARSGRAAGRRGRSSRPCVGWCRPRLSAAPRWAKASIGAASLAAVVVALAFGPAAGGAGPRTARPAVVETGPCGGGPAAESVPGRTCRRTWPEGVRSRGGRAGLITRGSPVGPARAPGRARAVRQERSRDPSVDPPPWTAAAFPPRPATPASRTPTWPRAGHDLALRWRLALTRASRSPPTGG